MEKQVRDQESEAMERKRKQQGFADFDEPEEHERALNRKRDENHDVEAEPLAPFRRLGEPGSRK